MKLLLTSAGITNPTIAESILELVGKLTEDIAVAFVPTAANPIAGDKDTTSGSSRSRMSKIPSSGILGA